MILILILDMRSTLISSIALPTRVEVNDAESELTRAQLEVVKAHSDARVARVCLDQTPWAATPPTRASRASRFS